MALPSFPNSISLSQVNVELGRSATAQISMNDSVVRTLFGVGSGQISMSQGFGKSNVFRITNSSDRTDFNLRSWLVSQGWDQSRSVEFTNNASIYATWTGTYAMVVDGSFPSGLTIINNGNIIGKGGSGDGARSIRDRTNCAAVVRYTLSTAGGPALYVGTGCTFYNYGTIGGGGGGGGSSGANIGIANPGVCAPATSFGYSAGGAGGGGAGFGPGGAYNRFINDQAEGSVETICVGIGQKWASYSGGSGSLLSPGGGGAGANAAEDLCGTVLAASAGGSGGSLGASGSNGSQGRTNNNPVPFSDGNTGFGGAGGAAVVGSGNVNWQVTGARYGAIS